MKAFNYILIILIYLQSNFDTKAETSLSQISENFLALVINEIMADPSPVVGLPDREYIELFNNQSVPVNLKGFSLRIGDKLKPFPEIVISPFGYLLVTGTGGAIQLNEFGKTLELSGFVINNSGAAIQLIYTGVGLIDSIYYDPSLHRKECAGGGYSLERIDPARSCGQEDNWLTTLSERGGTPGSVNSVYASNPDHVAPSILSFNLTDEKTLKINLSERISDKTKNRLQIKYKTNGPIVDSLTWDEKLCKLNFFFHKGSLLNGVEYTLTINEAEDACGNKMPSTTLIFGFYHPRKGDLLISEVLFNPYPYGSDFVEIYNNSGRTIDLSEISLANRNEHQEIAQLAALSKETLLLQKMDYLAFTKDRENILQNYLPRSPISVEEIVKLPVLNDDSGTLLLLNLSGEIVDEIYYNEKMHSGFITIPDGVSLERISFHPEADNNMNWHSSSKVTRYATPGYKNSTQLLNDTIDDSITVFPTLFSPNLDGINDELLIKINDRYSGWLLNIRIFNTSGVEIRRLCNNSLLGNHADLIWNGAMENHTIAPLGIYILDIELFNIEGNRKSRRFAVVVSDSIN